MQRMMIRDGTKRRSLTRVSERELLRMTGCNVVIFLFAGDDDDLLLGMIFFCFSYLVLSLLAIVPFIFATQLSVLGLV